MGFIPKCFLQVNVDINDELCFQFQAPTNPFSRFVKGFIELSFSVFYTFSVISVKVAVFMGAPFAPCQAFGRTKNSKI